ncbi:MAG: DUF2282 domain-containing protein [Gammaproteobacteria bacterium]
MSKTIISAAAAAVAGLAALGTVAMSPAALAANGQGAEKCYGVVKAGHNDCGIPGGHACSGQSKEDGGPNWVYMPKGLCDKLVGGSTTPPQ